MTPTWTAVIGRALRPPRASFERCDREAQIFATQQRRRIEQSALALADCERRIDDARAKVFATGDGVVGSTMTDLEREWRSLRRAATAAEVDALRAFWAKVVPAAWIDQPRYRASDPTQQLAAAIALASDADGVARAESCARELARVLATWDVVLPRATAWRVSAPVVIDDGATALFAKPLAAAMAALEHAGEMGVVKRGLSLRRRVYRAARRRGIATSGRSLARELADVAFVDFAWRAASDMRLVMDDGRRFSALPNPTAPLVALWSTGYVLSAFRDKRAVLGAPVL